MLVTFFPLSSDISALNPIPPLCSSLKLIFSPILYPTPPSTTSIFSTEPLVTDVIRLLC